MPAYPKPVESSDLYVKEPTYKCDECPAVFTEREAEEPVPFGHRCKMPNRGRVRYCESHLKRAKVPTR